MASLKENWLFLDDTVGDRARMKLAVGDLGREIQLFLAGTMAEAKDILAKHDISVILSDYYLKNGTTSEKFIIELRQNWPNLPIVVVSGRTEEQSPIYRSGADVVLPKLDDLTAFSKAIATGVTQAKQIRAMATKSFSAANVYFPESVVSGMQRLVRRPLGNILVTSGSGMGRTVIARALAERLHSEHPARFSSGVQFFRCHADSPSHERALNQLFGDAQQSRSGSVGLFERAQDGILIIDDAHLLPQALQMRIKSIWEDGTGETNNGSVVRAARIFVIFTALNSDTGSASEKFERGFLQTVAMERVSIPDMIHMRGEYAAMVRFLLDRAAATRAVSGIHASDEFFNAMLDLVATAPLRVTFRSLVKTIELAVEQALYHRRTTIIPEDVGDAPFLYERSKQTLDCAATKLFAHVEESEPVSVEQWRELYDAARNGTLSQAVALLRQIMLTYATVRFKGSKMKIADALGVGRASLYRPNLRDYSSQRQDVSENESDLS